MARRDTIRASDADRETVAERLRRAAHEGRLTTEELEGRLAQAFKARTYGDLDGLMADLPVPRLPLAPGSKPARMHTRSPALRVLTLTAIALTVAVVAALAVAALVVAATGWIIWVVLAWFLMGRRRMHHAGSAARRRQVAVARRHGYAGSFTPWL